MQLDFNFNNKSPQILLTEDGKASYYRNFFSSIECNDFFEKLLDETPWQQENIKMFGKIVSLPRLTAWYGAQGKNYSYSGISMKPLPWTKNLLKIKSKVEEKCNTKFNSVLLNLYRNEKDSISWHSDDEPELGEAPIIASVSFGEKRRFYLKHKTKKEHSIKVDLENGSLILMEGKIQEYWKHQVPKSSKKKKKRINLTFRKIKT